MSIYKRGKFYWFKFQFDGRRIQRSTRATNPKVARNIEGAYRTQLAKGEVGIETRAKAPTLKDFIADSFLPHMGMHCASKPRTLEFWTQATARPLAFRPLSSARLDHIDERLIARYSEHACTKVKAGTVNRTLATLRRALRLAQEWRVIDRVPRIHMIPGERIRDFVLNQQQRETYIAAAEEPLAAIAVVLLETGLRLSEALSLQWTDISLKPLGVATRGYIAVRKGKSAAAKRNVSLTEDALGILTAIPHRSGYVFSQDKGASPVSRFTLSDQHSRAREKAKLPKDFVIHSLRHTFLTQLGAAGADAFTIMRIAGHSSITISQRYVHPTPESLERAFEQLEDYRRGVATKMATAVVPIRKMAASI